VNYKSQYFILSTGVSTGWRSQPPYKTETKIANSDLITCKPTHGKFIHEFFLPLVKELISSCSANLDEAV
jgi:hypothetical protein